MTIRSNGQIDRLDIVADFPHAHVPVFTAEERGGLVGLCSDVVWRSRDKLVGVPLNRKLVQCDHRERVAEKVELVRSIGVAVWRDGQTRLLACVSSAQVGRR